MPIYCVEQRNNVFASPGGIAEASLWFNEGLLKDHCDKYVFGVVVPEWVRFEWLVLINDLASVDNANGRERTYLCT
jgi:hypothetical protein